MDGDGKGQILKSRPLDHELMSPKLFRRITYLESNEPKGSKRS